MFIKAFKIQPETAEKIFSKHNVLSQEIMEVLKNQPIFRKVGGEQYLCIGPSKERYLTIFFTYHAKEAEIQTAYPSDAKQIKYYKKVKK